MVHDALHFQHRWIQLLVNLQFTPSNNESTFAGHVICPTDCQRSRILERIVLDKFHFWNAMMTNSSKSLQIIPLVSDNPPLLDLAEYPRSL